MRDLTYNRVLKISAEDRVSLAQGFAELGAPYRDQPTMLKVLHLTHQPRIAELQQCRAGRQGFLTNLRQMAEGGKIAAIESGRDCDCVEYSGKVHIIDATVAAYNALHDDLSDWADGPFRLCLERPSVAQRVKYESRDLVMEAHEDGHPHVIYSQFA